MLLRKALATSATAALLASGLVGAGQPAAGADGFKPYGSSGAPDQKLRKGCRAYTYRYRVTVPSDEWAVEIFLVGPKGGGVASGAFLSAADPDVGTAKFRLCRPSIIAGRYKIRMKVTYKEGLETFEEGFVKPSFFRLERR